MKRCGKHHNLQIQDKTKAVSVEDLERVIEELRRDIADREDATQRALANIRGEIANLYSLYKKHSCYAEWD